MHQIKISSIFKTLLLLYNLWYMRTHSPHQKVMEPSKKIISWRFGISGFWRIVLVRCLPFVLVFLFIRQISNYFRKVILTRIGVVQFQSFTNWWNLIIRKFLSFLRKTVNKFKEKILITKLLFPCNGIWVVLGNEPRIIPEHSLIYASFLIPISI